MSVRGKPVVPATPRVISPSPTPSERQRRRRRDDDDDDDDPPDSYLGPVTRSAAKRRQAAAGVGASSSTGPAAIIQENIDEVSESETTDDRGLRRRRARTRSRSPTKKTRKSSNLAPSNKRPSRASRKVQPEGATPEEEPDRGAITPNGHLAPPTIGTSGWNWRDFSRSPSPLGLIPIHRHFQTLIHKHEVPRKVLHVSIGFFVYWLYVSGTQTSQVTPFLMGALIPIATTDYLRHKYASLNATYVKYLGALMRETEYAGWNGVVFYLLGAWFVLHFFPKDVGVVAVMLLSWCDTAASTFGRLYGRYTPRIRRGKSLAGSLAAFVIGVATAVWFWGFLAPKTGPFPGDEQHPFMYRGFLRLPRLVADALGWTASQATIRGPAALGVMSLWSGFVAAGSEVIDLFGWDDNLTIPVLSGIGIWGFLKIFG